MPIDEGCNDDDDVDTFVPLHIANAAAVERVVRHYQFDGRFDQRWSMWYPNNTNLFEHAFWDRLYGPSGDSPEDNGMIDWFEVGGYDEC